jgi:integrase
VISAGVKLSQVPEFGQNFTGPNAGNVLRAAVGQQLGSTSAEFIRRGMNVAPNFHYHDLRHTFASWAVQRGAKLQEVKDLLGHRSLAMVLRYSHLSPEHLRSAVARLDAVLPAALPAFGSTQDPTHEVLSEIGCAPTA